MLLMMTMLTTQTAWAAGYIYVGYLDPTAPIGMQRKTVLNPVWVDDNTVEMGTAGETTWYLVSGTITKNTRIEVKGTVNLILKDGCNFTASEGIHVPSESALNIYAQSVANRGSLTATATNHNAAIGGNGGEDRDGDATSGENAGAITIYGGNITITNGNIGGGDGGNGSAGVDYFDDGLGGYTETPYAGNGGNGGNGNVTIYSGYVWVISGNIGGGKAGTGEGESGVDGSNGGGTVKLSWANTSDRIYADNYYGTVTLQKAFYNIEDANIIDAGVVNNNDLLNRKNLIYAGDSYTVTIGSMPDGVTATADLELSAEVKTAVVGQVVTISFSGVPDGKVPVVSGTYNSATYGSQDLIITDNGDGTYSFTMGDGPATITVSELKKNIATCEATVPDQSLGSNSYINYKFWDTPATIGETVTDGNTTLTLGTDYQFGRITYADLTNHSEFDMPDHVGDECLVEIKGIGNYGGSKYVRFDIVNPSGSGTWGSLSWALSNGELTISGTGDMVKPQNDGTYPWLTYKSYIGTITIEEGVTSIADGAFATAQNDYHYVVSTVNLPSSLTSIGEDAFAYCTGATITIPTGVTSIGGNAFLEVLKVIGSLNDNADNTTLVSLMHEAKRADVTISGRTLYKDGNWNTLCLPFDVDGFDYTPLQDAIVQELDVDGYYNINNPTTRYIYSYDENNHKYIYIDESGNEYKGQVSDLRQTGFDALDGTLYLYFKNASSIGAGKPYIVKWASGENLVNPVFTGVTISSTAVGEIPFTSGEFKGIYSPTNIYSASKDNLFLGIGKNNLDQDVSMLFWPNTTDYTLGAFRAYFHVDLTETNGVRDIVLNFDEQGTQTTGIIGHTEITETTERADAAWYTIDGVKLSGRPTKKGIYIHGGRKTVIK